MIPPRARRRTRAEAVVWLERAMRDERIPLVALDRLAVWAGAPANCSTRSVAVAACTRGPR